MTMKWFLLVLVIKAETFSQRAFTTPSWNLRERVKAFGSSVDENDATLTEVLKMIKDRENWAPVVEKGRTRVWLHKKSKNRHACILAKGVLNADPELVYALFADAKLAKSYNEFCEEIEDLESSPRTKISWSATKKIGIFKARDFVTLCHFRDLADGSRCVLNRAVDHPSRPPSRRYTRGEVVIAANIVRPYGTKKTHLTLLTQINPRGSIDTPLGAKIANQLVKKSPLQFFESIEKAAQQRGKDNNLRRQQYSFLRRFSSSSSSSYDGRGPK